MVTFFEEYHMEGGDEKEQFTGDKPDKSYLRHAIKFPINRNKLC